MRRIENGQVRLRRRSHVYESMQETIVALCYHGTAVHAKTCYFQGCPYRVAGEQLVVGLDSCEFNHTEFHYQMVNKLLSLFLSQGSVSKVSADVDIQESGDTTNAHSCAVLGLDGCQIAEVQPLNCLFGILCRLGNIEAVSRCHFFHCLQGSYLFRNLLTKLEITTTHTLTVGVMEIFLLGLDQIINSVKGNSSVIAYDSSASVGIRKTCQNLVVTGFHHFRCVNIKYSLIVSFVILSEDFVKLRAGFVAVHLTGFLRHLDSTVGHERTF